VRPLPPPLPALVRPPAQRLHHRPSIESQLSTSSIPFAVGLTISVPSNAYARRNSYCTNYYGDAAPAEADAGVCDWCLSDGVVFGSAGKMRPYNSPAASGCSKPPQQAAAQGSRSEQQVFPPISGCGKGAGKVTGGEHEAGGRRARRYKLLKDVLC
jgi:hypothetical protein